MAAALRPLPRRLLALAALLTSQHPLPSRGCARCPSRADVPSRGSDSPIGDPVRGLTTWQAMGGMNATRLDWIYTVNATFVAEAHARGYEVTLAMNANLPDGKSGTRLIGRTKNILGQPLSAPWMPPGQFRPDSPNYGCVNSPQYQKIAFDFADSLVSVGGDAIQARHCSLLFRFFSRHIS